MVVVSSGELLVSHAVSESVSHILQATDHIMASYFTLYLIVCVAAYPTDERGSGKVTLC